jgi:DNA-binding NtrC family response regulator
VVDDEAGILRITKMILEKHNYRVLEANDGSEALAAFAQQMGSIDAILTDIMMPYVDGVALIRAIKKMKPEMVFIASTGQGEANRVSELQALGVSNFLGKPYDAHTLLKTVGDTLSSARRTLTAEHRNPDTVQKTFGFTKIAEGVTTS